MFFQVFFKGVVGMLKQDGHPNLYFPQPPWKKNLKTHPHVTRSCSWSCLVLGLFLCLGLGLVLSWSFSLSWSWSWSWSLSWLLLMKDKKKMVRAPHPRCYAKDSSDDMKLWVTADLTKFLNHRVNHRGDSPSRPCLLTKYRRFSLTR